MIINLLKEIVQNLNTIIEILETNDVVEPITKTITDTVTQSDTVTLVDTVIQLDTVKELEIPKNEDKNWIEVDDTTSDGDIINMIFELAKEEIDTNSKTTSKKSLDDPTGLIGKYIKKRVSTLTLWKAIKAENFNELDIKKLMETYPEEFIGIGSSSYKLSKEKQKLINKAVNLQKIKVY